MIKHPLILGVITLLGLGHYIKTAEAQTINVTSTTPCWQNYTAYGEMWRNCGITNDWLVTIIMPWQYATGGYISLFIASILILFTYIKYHKVVYPLLIGTLMLPLSFALFPGSWLNFGMIMGSASLGFLIIHIVLRMTKEYA